MITAFVVFLLVPLACGTGGTDGPVGRGGGSGAGTGGGNGGGGSGAAGDGNGGAAGSGNSGAAGSGNGGAAGGSSGAAGGGSSGSTGGGSSGAAGGGGSGAAGSTGSGGTSGTAGADGGGADGKTDANTVVDAPRADSSRDASAPDGPTQGFLHPGLLHSTEDFDRMTAQVAAGAQPWKSGWDKLVANAHASLNWTPNPAAVVYRGADGVHPENYAQLFNDAAAAYALALRWKISGDAAYADKSVQVLNAWSAVLTGLGGNTDKFLLAGLQGHQIANAAEIMRTYSGWAPPDFARFKTMMLQVFYPLNHDFLARHNGDSCLTHFYANWDLCNMASVLAIGVLVDDRAIYNEAIDYFKNGGGNGAIGNAVFYLHPGNLGQWQESGRDQGHNTLGIGLMGTFCEMAWKQGDDMYGYSQNRFLAGAEYVASYNLGNTVPYVTYSNCVGVTQPVIAEGGRGNIRPIWELVYNHYVNRLGVAAPYSAAYAAKVRPEGGGGDYGSTSGGFDQIGYGTLTATLK
jgi:hypothetical protein